MSSVAEMRRVMVRMPDELLDRIDAWAQDHPLIEGNRSRAVRAAIEKGLEAFKKEKKS